MNSRTESASAIALPDPAAITDEQTARDALADLMVAVHQFNIAISQPAAAYTAYHAELFPGQIPTWAGLAEKLKEWVHRLYEILTKIVEVIVPATSFSITVGTTISVTVTFAVNSPMNEPH